MGHCMSCKTRDITERKSQLAMDQLIEHPPTPKRLEAQHGTFYVLLTSRMGFFFVQGPRRTRLARDSSTHEYVCTIFTSVLNQCSSFPTKLSNAGRQKTLLCRSTVKRPLDRMRINRKNGERRPGALRRFQGHLSHLQYK